LEEMISFGTSGAKARNFGRDLIAALEALRHPKTLRGPFDFAQGRLLKRCASTVVLAVVVLNSQARSRATDRSVRPTREGSSCARMDSRGRLSPRASGAKAPFFFSSRFGTTEVVPFPVVRDCGVALPTIKANSRFLTGEGVFRWPTRLREHGRSDFFCPYGAG